ncbi:unnamed protein product [Schistocephalus solidus]|uniref:Uncharacterized protein n=1 Tax=Schistocephalus solidus TaxID=70667 RepID=A0A183SQA1_SCHSO|nr:unnamed protein product [Schistocephalus solidus]
MLQRPTAGTTAGGGKMRERLFHRSRSPPPALPESSFRSVVFVIYPSPPPPHHCSRFMATALGLLRRCHHDPVLARVCAIVRAAPQVTDQEWTPRLPHEYPTLTSAFAATKGNLKGNWSRPNCRRGQESACMRSHAGKSLIVCDRRRQRLVGCPEDDQEEEKEEEEEEEDALTAAAAI